MESLSKNALNLRAGEWVQVRNAAEILATLDEHGRLEAMPFMPEMLRFCGKLMRVSKRADKTCDNIKEWSIRRVKNAVHLEGARCDGENHGECQASCQIFWKEAWLKRANPQFVAVASPDPEAHNQYAVPPVLQGATTSGSEDGETRYSCQATRLLEFTSTLSRWDVRQYVRDIASGNLSSGLAGSSQTERVIEMVLGALQLLRGLIISMFNFVQQRRRAVQYPSIEGALDRTRVNVLDLRAGELVQIKTKEEIVATLDTKNRNRGLSFDSEMVPYCGGIYRVFKKVYQIIDEKTGKMMRMKNPCIILEGVVCVGHYHRYCPRAIFSYWREDWLRRVSSAPALEGPSCESACDQDPAAARLQACDVSSASMCGPAR